MTLIPALHTFNAGAVIKSADVNANFALLRDTLNASGLFTDVPRTVAAALTLEAPLTASGGIETTSVVGSGEIRTGTQLRAIVPGAANDAAAVPWRVDVGADGVLGAFYVQLSMTPSANAALRVAMLQVGDDIALRPFVVTASRMYVGTGALPASLGEMLRVGGNIKVDGGVTASAFAGDASNLTGYNWNNLTGVPALSIVGHTHPISSVDGLTGVLNNLSPLVHQHNASDIVAGLLPWARIAPAPRVDFDAASVEAFAFVAAQTSSGIGAALPAATRPSNLGAGAWRWVKVHHADYPEAYLPVWVEYNV